MNGMSVNYGQPAGAGSIFTGAYAERQQKAQASGLALSSEQSDRIKQGIKTALNSLDRSSGSAKVSMSKADIDFLCSDEGFLKMKRDAEEMYALNAKQQQKIAAGRDSDDKFWSNTGDQWLTFSQALSEGGFYDGMNDDEVRDFEGLLEQITSGMDNLSKSQYNTGIDFGTNKSEGNFFMTSAEAMTSLASSTAALRYMSDNMIPDNFKDKFNGLIDMYKKHNEEILSDFHSPMESFNKLAANIHQAGRKEITKDSPLEEHKYTVMLGNINQTEAKKEDFQSQMSDLFKEYGETDNHDLMMDDVKRLFAKFVTDDSDDEGFRQYTLGKSEYLFGNIQKYWGNLIGRISQ